MTEKLYASMNTSEADDWLVNNTGNNFKEHVSSSSLNRTFLIAPIFGNMTATPGVDEIVFASRGKGWAVPNYPTHCTPQGAHVVLFTSIQKSHVDPEGPKAKPCAVYMLYESPPIKVLL